MIKNQKFFTILYKNVLLLFFFFCFTLIARLHKTNNQGPIIKRTLIEKFANEKAVVEESVAEDVVHRKAEVDLLVVK